MHGKILQMSFQTMFSHTYNAARKYSHIDTIVHAQEIYGASHLHTCKWNNLFNLKVTSQQSVARLPQR